MYLNVVPSTVIDKRIITALPNSCKVYL